MELYRAAIPQLFMATMARLQLPYAIVSDKYALHFSDVRLKSYDTHPSELSSADKVRLGREIGKLAPERGFDAILFYNNSPVMSRPYFEMLSHAGLPIYFSTRLPS